MKNLMGLTLLAVALALPVAPSNAHATGAAAAAAISGAAGASKHHAPATVGAGIVGATGYVFVNGVGWDGPNMVYCPPKIGFVKPSGVVMGSENEVKDGLCYGRSFRGSAAVVTAQQYIDELLGEKVAEVVSVAPVLGQWNTYGLIYYRATTK
jgi:hypothetical protein